MNNFLRRSTYQQQRPCSEIIYSIYNSDLFIGVNPMQLEEGGAWGTLKQPHMTQKIGQQFKCVLKSTIPKYIARICKNIIFAYKIPSKIPFSRPLSLNFSLIFPQPSKRLADRRPCNINK